MTLSSCDQVAERVALGEPLGELAAHVEGCSGCQNLVAMSSKLGAVHRTVDPGLGFTARMTVGAQHRLATRRRQRLAVGLAATVVSGAFGVFLVTRPPHAPTQAVTDPIPHSPPTMENPQKPENIDDDAPSGDDDDLAMLADLVDVEHSSRLSADWKHITRPLAAYRRLVKQAETP